MLRRVVGGVCGWVGVRIIPDLLEEPIDDDEVKAETFSRGALPATARTAKAIPSGSSPGGGGARPKRPSSGKPKGVRRTGG